MKKLLSANMQCRAFVCTTSKTRVWILDGYIVKVATPPILPFPLIEGQPQGKEKQGLPSHQGIQQKYYGDGWEMCIAAVNYIIN